MTIQLPRATHSSDPRGQPTVSAADRFAGDERFNWRHPSRSGGRLKRRMEEFFGPRRALRVAARRLRQDRAS